MRNGSSLRGAIGGVLWHIVKAPVDIAYRTMFPSTDVSKVMRIVKFKGVPHVALK